MKCVCGANCRCLDSRPAVIDGIGPGRRRRYVCDEGHRYSTIEFGFSDKSRNVNSAIKYLADESLKEEMRTLANRMLRISGGK
jgi:hypothetical protein